MLLDVQVSSTSRLGLEPIKGADGQYLYAGGIIPTRVMEVSVDKQKHEKGEFAGMEVPVLKVEFENLKTNASDPDRFHTHYFKPVGTKALVKNTTDQYENRKPEEIDADTQMLWKTLKHFLESLTGVNYRNIASIPKEDQVKYLNLPGIDSAEKRITEYQLFFDYIAKFVNGDGTLKSQIIDAEGKPLPLWVKMLPNYSKEEKRNAKYYEIPRYIGQGVFEPLKIDKGILVAPKIIRVKATESLALKATAAPGMSGASGLPPAGAGKIDPAVANLLA